MLVNRHNRAAYSSQAVRHVAEKINELHWESEPPVFDAAEKEIELLTKGTNLTSQNIIESLPNEWSSNDDFEESSSEDHTQSSRYEELRLRLKVLSKQRRTQRQKQAQFTIVQQLTAPFKNIREFLQPNIDSEGGELGRELAKMKELTVKLQSLRDTDDVIDSQQLQKQPSRSDPGPCEENEEIDDSMTS
ncbi:hypothetical protein MMC29_004141 [Sticta canariensis]|nr:hypothetical protein [Sticta canariensis]